MIKLHKARSLLYRRQIVQENIRWKALDEIYKIYMLLLRSDRNFSAKFRQTFSHFSAHFAEVRNFQIIFIEFCSDFDKILSEFRRCFHFHITLFKQILKPIFSKVLKIPEI